MEYIYKIVTALVTGVCQYQRTTYANTREIYSSDIEIAVTNSNTIDLRTEHWNFAGARRELSNSWLTQMCDTSSIRTGDSNNRRVGCYHEHGNDMLVFLQKKAWSEIRAKVFLTLGSRLSAELTELIFLRALEAEEVPMDKRPIKATYTIPNGVRLCRLQVFSE
jgi:hypothetical protein